MAHTAILKAVLHHSKKMDLTPARPCGAIQVSLGCRALRDHIPKCPDSPWACTATCSGDSLEQTPGDTTSQLHQIHLHTLSFWQWNFCFSVQTEKQYLWSVIRSKHNCLISRFLIFWQYPEAYHQKPVCSGSPACTGSLTPSGKNTVTQREQVCCKSHCLPN